MRWPSAYLATSSGMAMNSMRVSAQPDCPWGVRTRLHPSTFGAGLSGAGAAVSASSSESVWESSSQSSGGTGGRGMGGGGDLTDFFSFFFGSAFFLDHGGINGT